MLNSNSLPLSIQQGTIIYKDDEAIRKLFELSLSPEIFIKAVKKGIRTKLSKSIYSPRLCVGMSQWEDTIVGLREQLCQNGWTQCDKYNLNRTISPQNDFAIVVSSGDAGVSKDYNPTTLNKKGELSVTVVDTNNNIQLSFFPMETHKKKKKYSIETILHWFLLYYTDNKNIWFELSLPRDLDKDGRISSWFQRIVLPPVDISTLFDGDDEQNDEEIVEEEIAEDFEIAIEKKY